MAKKRIYEDHTLTNTEKSRRHSDAIAAIDEEFDEALSNIDWNRRMTAELSFQKWVDTYCVGLLIDDKPPERGYQVLAKMDEAMSVHKNYLICMARGQGKSCYVLCKCLHALSTGEQKFIVIISNNARAAGSMLQDLWRAISQPGTPFAQDYPEVCLPFQLCNGSFRRRQMYNGIATQIEKNASNLALATLIKKDGTPFPSSGGAVTCRGISSGIRGLRRGRQRVTAVILDDLQDSEQASNPEQVQKLLDLIKKDIYPLAGKERISILNTATPICTDDLVDKLKADSNWVTQTYPAILHYPKDMELWKQYFKMFDTESIAGNTHNGSLQFYKDNRDEMDSGSEVFNPSRYSLKDGHISGLQKLLEIEHVIGKAAFQAEYQMKPQKTSCSLDITPSIVVSRMNQYHRYEVPDGFTFVAASTDLNVSYGLTTTLVAFKTDMTAVVIDHFIKKVRIDTKANDTEYNQSVYNALADLGRQLKSYNIKIDGWGIDASGTPFDAVTSFSKNSVAICGIPACAMLGRASHMFNGFVRSRLRDEISRTVLCGDQQEHLKAGSGKKYMFWDSDLHREIAQKAFLSEVGSIGSCSLWNDIVDVHTEYSIQFCNEKLQYVKHGQDGRNRYSWKTAEPHDFLDSTAQAFAVASSQGISASNINKQSIGSKPSASRKLMKKKVVRIV